MKCEIRFLTDADAHRTQCLFTSPLDSRQFHRSLNATANAPFAWHAGYRLARSARSKSAKRGPGCGMFSLSDTASRC